MDDVDILLSNLDRINGLKKVLALVKRSIRDMSAVGGLNPAVVLGLMAHKGKLEAEIADLRAGRTAARARLDAKPLLEFEPPKLLEPDSMHGWMIKTRANEHLLSKDDARYFAQLVSREWVLKQGARTIAVVSCTGYRWRARWRERILFGELLLLLATLAELDRTGQS